MAGARGEGTILTEDGEVHVLFTNRALAIAERELGRGIIGVLEGFTDGSSGITETATLLRVGMESARRDARIRGPRVTAERAYEILDEVGFAEVVRPVMEAVAAVIGYTPEDGSVQEDGDPNV
jgi:hypothetical protein